MWLSTTARLHHFALFVILFASLLQVQATSQEDGNEFGVEELDQILEKGEEHLKLLNKLELESREKFPASNRRRSYSKRKQPSQYAHSFYNESIIFQVATKELMKNVHHRKKRDVDQMNFEKANEYVEKRVREKRSKKEWSILWPRSYDSKHAEEYISEIGSCDPTARYRTFNGRCNNLKYPNYGAKDEIQNRLRSPSYADGVSEPRKYGKYGGLLPNPRRISLTVHTEEDNLDQQYNLFVMQWGQFEDHDLVISPEVRGLGGGSLECPCESDHPECFNIPFPPGDNSHPSLKCFEFVRSLPRQPNLGTREQINGNTAYLDASTVYGNDAFQAQQLRNPGGFLKTTEDNRHKSLLPLVPTTHACHARDGECFMAGEGRVNEQPGLTSLHTVFVREHNTIVSKLTQMNPQWDDEKLYQEARKIVAAFNQHITFNEFLPRVLGPSNILQYKLDLVTTGYFKGYDQECDAGILNEFATAAYRFGHSLIRNHLALFSPGRHGRSISEIALHNHFDNPDLMKSSVNMDHLLRGLLLTPMQKFDSNVASELTERLFPDPTDPFSGFDLVALNIQRGRDHGLPSYVYYRKLCKLDVHLLQSFEDLRDYMDDVVVERLKSVYDHVEDIDLFTGGLSEKAFGGAMVGPTFACIIGIQYRHLRKCDRFWYENDFSDTKFSEDQLREIRGTTLSGLICRNLENPYIEEVPKYGFDQVSSSNPLVNCITGDIQHFDLEPWRDYEQPEPPRGSCQVDGRIIPFKSIVRVSPCQECVCYSGDVHCSPITHINCVELVKEYGANAVSNDKNCQQHCEVNSVDGDTGPCFKVDTDYLGHDINLKTASTYDKRNSPSECQTLCYQRHGCLYFTWTTLNECFLKSNGGHDLEVPYVGSTSGPRECYPEYEGGPDCPAVPKGACAVVYSEEGCRGQMTKVWQVSKGVSGSKFNNAKSGSVAAGCKLTGYEAEYSVTLEGGTKGKHVEDLKMFLQLNGAVREVQFYQCECN